MVRRMGQEVPLNMGGLCGIISLAPQLNPGHRQPFSYFREFAGSSSLVNACQRRILHRRKHDWS